MAYSPTTDFLALLRQTSSGVRTERMPGLDYVVAALARAGLFRLSVGQTAPTTNQATTAWLQPSVPSWVAEGTVWLWNVAAGAYQPATAALWNALLAPSQSSYSFQSVNSAAATVLAGTSLLAVQRAGPAATALTLPGIAAQSGKPLRIADWSTAVANHVLTLTPAEVGATIMQRPTWSMVSTADQLQGLTLYPSTDLNGWVIAP